MTVIPLACPGNRVSDGNAEALSTSARQYPFVGNIKDYEYR